MNLNEYRDLPVGSKLPIAHCNPKKESAVIFRNADRITFYCSRCGETQTLRLRRILSSLLPARLFTTTDDSIIPPDTSYTLNDFPYEALKWLNCLGWHQACMQNIGYSPSMRRVVLPVYALTDFWHSDPPIAAQLRAVFPDQKPKYLTTAGSASLVYSPRIRFHRQKKALVLVEDILSAINLSVASPEIYPFALLGTSATLEVIKKIFDVFQVFGSPLPIILWFDNDAAGDKATRHVKRLLELYGRNVLITRTTKDPKHLTYEEINARLNTITCDEVPEGIQCAVRSDTP